IVLRYGFGTAIAVTRPLYAAGPRLRNGNLSMKRVSESPAGTLPAAVSCRVRLVSFPVGDGCRSTLSPRAFFTGCRVSCAASGRLMNITDASTVTTADASGLRFMVVRESVESLHHFLHHFGLLSLYINTAARFVWTGSMRRSAVSFSVLASWLEKTSPSMSIGTS